MQIARIRGEITDVETIAAGRSVARRAMLRNRFGPGRWRKMKGRAWVELQDGRVVFAELHWYEAHGIGRHLWKIKRVLS